MSRRDEFLDGILDALMDETMDEIFADENHPVLQILRDAPDQSGSLNPPIADWIAELQDAMTRPIPGEPCCDMSGHPHMHVTLPQDPDD